MSRIVDEVQQKVCFDFWRQEGFGVAARSRVRNSHMHGRAA